MDWHLIAAVLVTMAASYLLGCCNTSIVISKYVLRDDVRNHGSGNAGLTNFYRVFGKQKILLVILADVLKTVIAVLAGAAHFRWAGNDPIIGKLLGGLLCMVGHMFPFQFEFKGGKGVLVAAGAILAVQPVLLPVLALIFLVCLVPTGMVSLGSITMAAAYPVLTLVYSLMRGLPTQDVVVCTVGAAIMGGMVIWMHRSNIQRIRDGKEYRFGQKHKNS